MAITLIPKDRACRHRRLGGDSNGRRRQTCPFDLELKTKLSSVSGLDQQDCRARRREIRQWGQGFQIRRRLREIAARDAGWIDCITGRQVRPHFIGSLKSIRRAARQRNVQAHPAVIVVSTRAGGKKTMRIIRAARPREVAATAAVRSFYGDVTVLPYAQHQRLGIAERQHEAKHRDEKPDMLSSMIHFHHFALLTALGQPTYDR